jgi:hypothetical protein
MNYLNGDLAVFSVFTNQVSSKSAGKTILVTLTTHVLPLLTKTNHG